MMNDEALTVERARELIANDEWLSSRLHWLAEPASQVPAADQARERFELEQEICFHVFRRLGIEPLLDPVAKEEIEEDVIAADALKGITAVLNTAANIEAGDFAQQVSPSCSEETDERG